MLFIECRGTPYEIGYRHGHVAKLQIDRSIDFYASLFLKNCKKEWQQVLQHALVFEQRAKTQWPTFHEEMQGIADGSGRELLEIVALNVRTEINFGLFSDGCTSLAWHTGDHAWLAQNWDVSVLPPKEIKRVIDVLTCKKWLTEQKQNLIITKIEQAKKPTIMQITEAGIIGKIGFNSSGVGTLFNAIRVHGVDPTRMPAHFGLRMALESSSVDEAVRKLEGFGMASSAHILVADATTAIGLEFTKTTFARLLPDPTGKVVHTNHLLLEHPGEIDTVWLKDSLTRIQTMTENAGTLGQDPSWEQVARLFEDEQNSPGSICRVQTKETGSGTLFNIVMDLKRKKAILRMGRPTEVEESVSLEL